MDPPAGSSLIMIRLANVFRESFLDRAAGALHRFWSGRDRGSKDATDHCITCTSAPTSRDTSKPTDLADNVIRDGASAIFAASHRTQMRRPDSFVHTQHGQAFQDVFRFLSPGRRTDQRPY